MVTKWLKKIFGGSEASPGKVVAQTQGAQTHDAGPVAFVEYVVGELVDDPASVKVEVEESEDKVSITVRCASADMGKVIGRKGRTVGAIRALVAGTAKRDSKKIVVDIVD